MAPSRTATNISRFSVPPGVKTVCRQRRGKLWQNAVGKVAARPATARQNSLTNRSGRVHISHAKRSPKANLGWAAFWKNCPPVDSLNVVEMVISPGSPHAPGVDVIGNNNIGVIAAAMIAATITRVDFIRACSCIFSAQASRSRAMARFISPIRAPLVVCDWGQVCSRACRGISRISPKSMMSASPRHPEALWARVLH
jgi:hypothetical protein